MFEKGQILENKYEITEHIGTGGGGVVYKARDIVHPISSEARNKLESIILKAYENYVTLLSKPEA